MGNILGKQGERKAKEGSKADADAAEKGKKVGGGGCRACQP